MILKVLLVPPRGRSVLHSPCMAEHIIQGEIAGTTATIVFLHGLGDSGAGWRAHWTNIRRHLDNNIRVILPTAPRRSVTINRGAVSTAWHDIVDLDTIAADATDSIQSSIDTVKEIIAREQSLGRPLNKIFIGGFSQGAALSLGCLLLPTSNNEKLAGIIALSGYLPLQESIKQLKFGEGGREAPPIFIGHGESDHVVRYRFATEAKVILESIGLNVTFHTYQTTHSTTPQEINDLEEFLQAHM